MADTEVMVRRAFEAYIQETFNRALSFLRLEDFDATIKTLPKDISRRLVKLVDYNLLLDIKRDKSKNVVIYVGILQNLYKFGVTKDQLPSLRALADYLKGSYHRSTGGKHVVKVTVARLSEYFDNFDEEDD